MERKDFYNTIERAATTEFKDRGSRFVAFAMPIVSVEDFKLKLAELKKDHPKATHHCFAYRLGIDGNNFRSSDAGEPAGTAGKPILGQIDSKLLTNTLVIVVRYFGGSLLGVPGLIHAYKSVTALVLQLTAIVQKPVEHAFSLQFDYTQLNEVMTIVKQYQCSLISQEAQLFYQMQIGIPQHREEEVMYKLKLVNHMEVKKI